jgi:phage regulator Rha-like protein
MEELVKSRSSEELISSRQIAEVTDKRHADVIRDIRVLVDKKAIDLIVNLNANLRSIQDRGNRNNKITLFKDRDKYSLQED